MIPLQDPKITKRVMLDRFRVWLKDDQCFDDIQDEAEKMMEVYAALIANARFEEAMIHEVKKENLVNDLLVGWNAGRSEIIERWNAQSKE